MHATSRTIPSIASVKSILLIPFEDQELIASYQHSYPNAKVTILQKQDLAGLSLRGLLSLVRKDHHDLAVASLHSSAVRRSLSSVEFLLLLARAKHRVIHQESGEFSTLTPSLSFVAILRLLAGIALGLAVVVWNYILTILQGSTKNHEKFSPRAHSTQRVLFLRTDLPGETKAGGSISHVKGMITAFQKVGFEVVYVADVPLQALTKDVKQIQIKPIAVLDFFDEFQLLAYNLQCIRHLGQIIRNYQPSLIYQRHSIFNFSGGVLARRFNIPFVLEANDSEVWIKKNWSRLILEQLAVRCETTALHSADRIAVISQGVHEQLRPYNVKQERFLFNPNGVDPEEFHPDINGAPIRERYAGEGDIVVGFIGTFTRWHGVETLFNAAVIAVQKEKRLKFLFIGDGNLRSALEKRTLDFGMQNSLIFTGLVPHAEASSYLAACDILVSPHLGFEDGTKFFGSPTKLFEYMAMGKAIIASQLEQIGEVITNEVNGLHMKPGDARQLAELVLKLANDKELRERLGSRARQDVVARYTWEKNVERIVQSLNTIAE